MKTDTFALIRKIASIVLAICFVLPLSRCTTHIERQGMIVTTDTSLYGFKLLRDGGDALWKGDAEGALLLLAVTTVFFLPILCLRLREQPQALIHCIGALVSEYCLFMWVFVFASAPQIGGLVAILCWAALFCTASATLFQCWRSGTALKRNA